MVVDLDLLDRALRDAAAQVEGADLERIQPAGAEAVTVEVFARWVHGQLADALGRLPGVTLAVRVWESATAFGGYTAPL
jgi:6-pyruvoyltetrahydropterin/6-carboxytetrahydropterin synthase